MSIGAVVLAGGRSRRMGTAKADLEWHGSTLLRRTVGVVSRATGGPVVVVGAPDAALPELPADVRIVTDPVEGRGPLQGLAVGLDALASEVPIAFCCSTDLPFLHTAFVRRVVGALGQDTEVVVPQARGHRQPLAAAYRTVLADRITELLDEGGTKPMQLFQRSAVTWLDDTELLEDAGLAACDPRLESVVNVNDPAEYAAARGRPAPMIAVECFGTLAAPRGRGPHQVRAATLALAAEGVGLVLDGHIVAALNGDAITRDPHLPLELGDRVAFLSADAGG